MDVFLPDDSVAAFAGSGGWTMGKTYGQAVIGCSSRRVSVFSCPAGRPFAGNLRLRIKNCQGQDQQDRPHSRVDAVTKKLLHRVEFASPRLLRQISFRGRQLENTEDPIVPRIRVELSIVHGTRRRRRPRFLPLGEGPNRE